MTEANQNRAIVPDDWQPLLEYTDHVLAPFTGSPDISAVNKVMSRAHAMGNNRLEELRYYGFSEECAAFGRHISDETNRVDLITRAAGSLAAAHYATHGEQNHAGLYLSDLTYEPIQPHFIGDAIVSTHDVPRDVLFLTDCLHIVSAIRRGIIKRGEMASRKAQALDLVVTPANMGNIAPMASTGLYRRALIDTYMLRHQVSNLEAESKNPLIRQMKTEAAIRKIRVMRLARFMARLRGDEQACPEVLEPCITRSVSGEYIPDTTKLSEEPPPPGTLKLHDPEFHVIHDRRLVCPALKVKELFENVIGMVPEIMILADRQIRGEPPQPELELVA